LRVATPEQKGETLPFGPGLFSYTTRKPLGSPAPSSLGIHRKGLTGKHLPAQSEKAMEINRADVAELVDARDLKFVVPFGIHRIFCLTRPETKTQIDAKGRDLHNARIAVLALIAAPAFGQAVAPHCDTWCTAFAWLGGVFEATARRHGILAETALLLWAASLTRSPSSQSAKSRRSCASNLWLA
jgi:hypothetical protein